MKRNLAILLLTLTLGLLPAPLQAARIADLTQLGGNTPNELIGFGLVVGLKGTGDGGDYQAAMRPLQQLLIKMGDPVTVTRELKNSNNVAIVMLSVSVPPQGARTNQKLDIKVSSIGTAKSLKGGRLLASPMTGVLPNSGIAALASGDLTLEDEAQPTQATIRAGTKSGATLMTDFISENIDAQGYFTLVLDPTTAGFANATALVDSINGDVSFQTDGKEIAFAIDATTIAVQIPKAERGNPAQFIARIQQLPIVHLPPQVAKITINSKTKTIVFAGEVELAPTILSQGSLTITVTGNTQPANPPGSQVPFVGLDPAKQGGAKFNDLLESFNMLKVSPDDRISIIKQLHDSGALRCQLEVD